MKLCVKCNTKHPETNFYTDLRMSDGLRRWCKDCMRINHRNWCHKNKEKCKNEVKQWYKNNPEKASLQRKKWRIKNISKVNEYYKRWRKENLGIIIANNTKRKTSKIQRTPVWADLEEIKKLYVLANKNGMHVDHIIPLNGKLVSGLHVIENLQLLPPTENISKSNKFNIEA